MILNEYRRRKCSLFWWVWVYDLLPEKTSLFLIFSNTDYVWHTTFTFHYTKVSREEMNKCLLLTLPLPRTNNTHAHAIPHSHSTIWKTRNVDTYILTISLSFLFCSLSLSPSVTHPLSNPSLSFTIYLLYIFLSLSLSYYHQVSLFHLFLSFFTLQPSFFKCLSISLEIE